MPREKSRYRERNRDKRSSSYDSDSSYESKKSKSKHKRRSRARDRSVSSSYKRKRSPSRSKHRRRSYSRSVSRDRYDSKSRKRSSSRSRSKRSVRRSLSRNKSHSRSSSHSRNRYSKKKSSKRSRSSSRSPSHERERPIVSKKYNLDDTESKVEKAIKAAAAAGLTMTKIPTYEVQDVEIKEDMPTIQDRNILNELNSDSFVQRRFTSSRSKKQQNIIIDLDSDTVKMPDVSLNVKKPDSIIDFDALPSEEELKEAWIKKLYLYRKKMLRGES